MSEQSQQSRSTDALAAAAATLATAARVSRNINRLRGHQLQPPRNPVNLDNLIVACISIHEITGSLGKVVDHYAQAVRWPMAGYSGSRGQHEEYPGAVIDAAANAEHQLRALAEKLRAPAVGFSTDAIAGLDIALSDWRTRTRRRGATV